MIGASFRIFKGVKSGAALLLLGAGLLQGNAVTYTFSGSGTGSLGTTDFTNANFVVTLDGDTSEVAIQPPLGSIPGIIGLPVDIDITGVGTVNFTGTTFIFTYSETVGFGEDNSGLTPPPGNLIQITAANLSGYGLTSDIISSGGNTVLGQFVNAATSGGSLTFTSMSTVTFNANVSSIPEPSAVALVGGAMAVLTLLKRMRKNSIHC